MIKKILALVAFLVLCFFGSCLAINQLNKSLYQKIANNAQKELNLWLKERSLDGLFEINMTFLPYQSGLFSSHAMMTIAPNPLIAFEGNWRFSNLPLLERFTLTLDNPLIKALFAQESQAPLATIKAQKLFGNLELKLTTAKMGGFDSSQSNLIFDSAYRLVSFETSIPSMPLEPYLIDDLFVHIAPIKPIDFTQLNIEDPFDQSKISLQLQTLQLSNFPLTLQQASFERLPQDKDTLIHGQIKELSIKQPSSQLTLNNLTLNSQQTKNSPTTLNSTDAISFANLTAPNLTINQFQATIQSQNLPTAYHSILKKDLSPFAQTSIHSKAFSLIWNGQPIKGDFDLSFQEQQGTFKLHLTSPMQGDLNFGDDSYNGTFVACGQEYCFDATVIFEPNKETLLFFNSDQPQLLPPLL